LRERRKQIGPVLAVLILAGVAAVAWTRASGETQQGVEAALEAERQAMQAGAEAERQGLLATDRAWAAAAKAGDIDEVVSFWSADARLAMPGQPTLVGKAALREMVERDFAAEGFEISWEPEGAEVGGALGYTWGHNESTMLDEQGDPVTTRGRYLTVWRKQRDGTWKCVMDFINQGPM